VGRGDVHGNRLSNSERNSIRSGKVGLAVHGGNIRRIRRSHGRGLLIKTITKVRGVRKVHDLKLPKGRLAEGVEVEVDRGTSRGSRGL
jgi:hypothetical protein